MKPLHFFAPILLSSLALGSCGPIAILAPPVNTNTTINNAAAASKDLEKREGIYRWSSGTRELGTKFVCKVTGSNIALYSRRDGIYIIVKPTSEPSRFTGFWRYTKKNKQGVVDLTLNKSTGVIEGKKDGNPFSLKFERPFTQTVRDKNFLVLAHRGVQTESYPPYAENSLDGLKHIQGYGLDGIEMDIRLSSDNIPIVAHDEAITPRMVRKSTLVGNWNAYTFQAIKEQVELRDGQRVPSLAEALNTFVDSTTLTYFWMDVKGGDDIFKYIEPVVRAAYAKAAMKKRKVVILAGIPSTSVLDELQKQTTYKNLPMLFEQDVELAVANGGIFYAPRYTEGMHLKEADIAHTNGIKIVCWTINKKSTIRRYLKQGKFDGFLTDNPAYVMYSLYTLF